MVATARPVGPGPVALTTCASLDALPADAAALFGGAGFFSSIAWYRTAIAHALPAGAEPCFVLCRVDGAPAALFAMQRRAGTLQSLTTPYTCLYRPLLRPGLETALVRQVGLAFGRFCRGWARVRIDALPAEWDALAPLLAGCRAAGLAVRRFDHFGNWVEPVRGRAWAAYLRDRPGPMRETIRRKLRRCEDAAHTEIIRSDGLDAGIAAYARVYARSWKEPEPFPHFTAALMRAAAGPGLLRLGVMRVDGEPVAAQFWIVAEGRAAVLKLAHDEAYKPLSPGTALTALMIRALLAEGVTELDFGRGDDPYKALWTTERRQRIGVLLLNPRRLRGAAALGLHALGRLRQIARGSPRRPG